MGVSALMTYSTIQPPPPNPWIGKQTKTAKDTVKPPTPPEEAKPIRRPKAPSRRLIKHVLRARVKAAEDLAEFLAEVERSGQRVRASAHLAKIYGSPANTTAAPAVVPTGDGASIYQGPQSSRSAREVISFLRNRGARIDTLGERQDGDWALSGDETDADGLLSPALE